MLYMISNIDYIHHFISIDSNVVVSKCAPSSKSMDFNLVLYMLFFFHLVKIIVFYCNYSIKKTTILK